MINLVISIATGLVLTTAFGFLLGGGDFRPLYGLAPGIIGMVAVYIYLARRISQKVLALSQLAQNDMQAQNFAQAIERLKQGFEYQKWQFFVASQIHGQIGQILYMQRKFDEAESHLKKSFKRNWIAQAMLAVLYYKRSKSDAMVETFESAVKYSKKESLLWNLYAYCLWKSGKLDRAIEVLNRATEYIPKDEKTKSNLNALRNKRKMKMRGWNLMWYQFHLDRPPAQRQQMQFRRR